MTRKQIYTIIEKDDGSNVWSYIYDCFMLVMIVISVVPLMFWTYHTLFWWIEIGTTVIFIVDYLMRWITADIKLGRGKLSFLIYPFTFWAIIDILSILPSFNILTKTFRLTRTVRLFKTLRLLKALRYSSQMLVFFSVLRKERRVLCSVLVFALCYIFVTALLMFNVEPHFNPESGEVTFESFFDALYWSAVTLTTVGYGDMCPATDAGRLISMVSAMFGIAIIALPSGIITASYIDELKTIKSEKLTERLHKSFRRVVCRANNYHPRYMIVPQNLSVVTLQVKQGLTMEQVSDIIEYSQEFRLRNMATAVPVSQHPDDRIVVEHFPVNRLYGCCIDRGSKVTIAATTSNSEAGIGSFSYYLALIGGFNYISKEVDANRDEPVNFYNAYESAEDAHFQMYLHDLNNLVGSNRDAWVITPLSCFSSQGRKFHFVHNTSRKNAPSSDTIINAGTFKDMLYDVKMRMEKDFSISVGENEDYSLPKSNIAFMLSKHVNTFSLRVSYDITCWDDKRIDKICVLASMFSKYLVGNETNLIVEDLQENGFGYKNI